MRSFWLLLLAVLLLPAVAFAMDGGVVVGALQAVPLEVPIPTSPGMVAAMFRSLAVWAAANPQLAFTLAIGALTSLANGAMKLGHANWAMGFGKLIDLISPFARADAGGTFKWPLVTRRNGKFVLSFSLPPTQPEVKEAVAAVKDAATATKPPGVASLLLPLALGALALSGCDIARPHGAPVSDAPATAYAVLALLVAALVWALWGVVKWSRGLPVAVLLLGCLSVGASGCVDAFATVKATAATANETITQFKQWDSAHVKSILDDAAPACEVAADTRACFEQALLPYQTKRAPVLTAAALLGPPLADVEKAVKAGSGDPSALSKAIGQLLADLTTAIAKLKGGGK